VVRTSTSASRAPPRRLGLVGERFECGIVQEAVAAEYFSSRATGSRSDPALDVGRVSVAGSVVGVGMRLQPIVRASTMTARCSPDEYGCAIHMPASPPDRCQIDSIAAQSVTDPLSASDGAAVCRSMGR